MPLTPARRLELLANVELFDGLNENQLLGICEVVRTKTLKRKEELFHKGDDGRQVFIIISGKLRRSRRRSTATTSFSASLAQVRYSEKSHCWAGSKEPRLYRRSSPANCW